MGFMIHLRQSDQLSAIRMEEGQFKAHQARVKAARIEMTAYTPGLGFVPVDKPQSKMRNTRIVTDEGSFDSKRELERYRELALLEKAGKITDLKHHVVFSFDINGVHICKYEADFQYHDNASNVGVIEDVKPKFKDEAGCKKYQHTDIYRRFLVKKRLMLALHGIDVREV